MIRRSAAAILGLALAIPFAGKADPSASPVAAADVVAAVWQHHKMTVNYFGVTAAYSCDALEQHVRDILLHFGARKDVKVDANGCARGPEVPSHDAWIQTDFYTLAPAESAAAKDTVKAHWAAREVTPHRPSFMGDGDCELIEQVKDLISKSFALRELQYRSECVPHEIVVDGFAVKAQALIATDQPSS
jgi:hypothetical protein